MEVNETSTLTYPVTAQDRLNYLIGLLSSDQQIAIMFRLSAPLDIELLERAFQLTVKLVPILNCSFVEAENPYWESMPGSGQRATLCSFTECSEEDIERRVNEYIAEPGDRMKAPMIQARLFRARKDRLCVKISHLCSDAAGLKEYMELLASIYTHLCRSADPDMIENDFLANPKKGFRDQSKLFAELGIKDIKSLLRQDEGAEYLWVFPSNPTVNDQPKVAIRRLEGRLMENLLCRTKKYGATVNDFLCTAYLRCLADQTVFMEPLKKEKGAICFTVDLRQYLPDLTTGTVCNFSGSEVIAIDLQKGERFEATLVKVKKAIDEIKIKQPGLSSAAMMELIAEAPLPAAKEDVYRQKQTLTDGMNTVMPYLTNMGIVSEKPLVFGAAEADDGYMIGPITYAPFFCMGVSTYNGVLTLSIGFHTPAVSEREVNRVLDIMMRELGC